jgi:hypothetical protein
MNDQAIIEAAARALFNFLGSDVSQDKRTNDYVNASRVVLAAVAPLIRAAALEEAAQVADKIEYMPPSTSFIQGKIAARNIAADIRALKEQP